MKSRLHAGFRKPASAKSQSQVASVLRDQSQGLVPEPVQIAVSLDVGRVGHAIHGEIETQVFPSTQLNWTNPPPFYGCDRWPNLLSHRPWSETTPLGDEATCWQQSSSNKVTR